MNPTVKSAMLLIPLGLMCFSTMAQQKKDAQEIPEKDKTILIRPNADSKEKFTIVVEGDKVTINGKPVDEFKSKDVDITRGDDPERQRGNYFEFSPDRFPFKGGWNMTPERPAIPMNKAILGVKTEKSDEGALVMEINPESAAEKAGLKKGDIITRLNDTYIKDAESLYKEVGKYQPGDKVNITYLRESKSYTTAVVLEKNTAPAAPRTFQEDREQRIENGDFDFRMFPRLGPDRNPMEPDAYRKPKLGLQIQDTEENNGVKILDVTENAPADKAGLQKDDIITSVNGKPVRSSSELKGFLKETEKSGVLNITYKRGNKVQQATIKIPRKLEVSDL